MGIADCKHAGGLARRHASNSGRRYLTRERRFSDALSLGEWPIAPFQTGNPPLHLLVQLIEKILHLLVVLQVNPIFERLGEKGFRHPPILRLA